MHTSTGLPRGYIISPLTRLNAVATPRLPGSILLETMSEGMISCRACRAPCWPVPDISVVSWTRLRSGYRVDITRKRRGGSHHHAFFEACFYFSHSHIVSCRKRRHCVCASRTSRRRSRYRCARSRPGEFRWRGQWVLAVEGGADRLRAGLRVWPSDLSEAAEHACSLIDEGDFRTDLRDM